MSNAKKGNTYRADSVKPGEEQNKSLIIPVSQNKKSMYVKAAQLEGKKLAPWIKEHMDEAAADVFEKHNVKWEDS